MHSRKILTLAAALFAASLTARAATYTFNGSISSDWATAGNWNGSSIGPTNASYGHRIDVTGGSSLVYSAAQGTTTYSSTARSFVIQGGSLTFTGGSFTSNNTNNSADILGNSATGGSLVVDGGTFKSNAVSFNNSLSAATNTLTVQSGSATITTLVLQGPASSTSIVNLNGGTLAVSTLTATGAGTKTLNFNGGTFKTTAALTLTGFTNAFVKAGGLVIDTNTFNSTFTQALRTDAVSTGGGLTKSGAGTLTLGGDNTYTGDTTVISGTVALGAADRIANASNLVMSGGTFATGGFNETLGTLGLTADSVIDLGDGASALVFADSSGVSWTGSFTLSFINFTDGSDTIRIGTGATGLTELQLSRITINGFAAAIDADGFLSVSAIPEPSSYVMVAGLGTLAFAASRRRRLSNQAAN